MICPAQFSEPIKEWTAYRQSQGETVRQIPAQASAEELAQSIRTVEPPPKYILIVGDAPTIGTRADPQREVPIHYAPTTVSAAFGSTPTLATDAPYGDIDQDGLNDAAVGRLPVKTPQQLSALVRRIKAYESSQDFSSWRERVQLVGGVGGFGMLADAAIESVTRLMVTASLPSSVRTSVAYGSPGHLFYPPQRFTEAVSRRYNMGCRFWVYAGHGMVDQLDRVPAGSSGIAVLDGNSIRLLEPSQQRAPIALLLCCYTGAIDAGTESFAAKMLRHEGGPIAVIAGSRVTMPYGNATLTLGLIDSIYGEPKQGIQPVERLGDAWSNTLKQMRSPKSPEQTRLRTMLDGVATLVSPAGTKLEDERAEHSLLYSLLGDPLLRLHPPKAIELETETGFDFGAPVVVRVRSPIDGQCTLTLDHPLGEKYSGGTSDAVFRDPNELTLASKAMKISAGIMQTFSLSVPDDRTGLVTVRAHVAGDQDWASGGCTTIIRPPTKSDGKQTEQK